MNHRLPVIASTDRAAWLATLVEVLRSGLMVQGRSRLVTHGDNGVFAFCCLGVGCAITKGVSFNVADTSFTFLSEPAQGTLPRALARDLRMCEDPVVSGLGKYSREASTDDAVITLSMLNDDGFTFNQIADLITYFGIGIKDWEE